MVGCTEPHCLSVILVVKHCLAKKKQNSVRVKRLFSCLDRMILQKLVDILDDCKLMAHD